MSDIHSQQPPLRVAIVGSGPAGMYAASHLLGRPEGTWLEGKMVHLTDRPIEVDVIDRLPTPYGLVRGGVAPDHPERKRITRAFEEITSRDAFAFYGNVEVGRDMQADELSGCYHAVIYATGAAAGKKLGVPGEELAGCATAGEFVAWYNGHPDAAGLEFDLSSERAVVAGNGNVAVDVARMLARPPGSLAKTDISDQALDALHRSKLREVVVIGRRGPAQAAFSCTELEELGRLDGVDVVVDVGELPAADLDEQALDWDTRRKLEILRTLAARHPTGAARRIVLRFGQSPVEVLGSDCAQGLRLATNTLEIAEDGRVTATPNGQTQTLSAGLVLAAVGYEFNGIPGLDSASTGVVQDGERLQCDGRIVPGTYVAGWLKRGATGVIGTNRRCARDTVRALLQDHAAGRLPQRNAKPRHQMEALLRQRQPELVTRDGWRAIDCEERRAGAAAQRPRVKLTTRDALLVASRQQPPTGDTPVPINRMAAGRRLDAIVVGSGLGGLSTAACLAAAGKSVLVLEQHEIAGGCSQTFRRKGIWEFDAGVHYVGGCVPGSDGTIPTVLRGLGVEDRIEWSRMDDEGMDTVTFPGHAFRVPTNWEGMAENLRRAFPDDADGLTRCVAELRRIGEGVDRINDVPHSVSVLLPLLKRPAEALAIARGLEQPIGRLFDRCRLGAQARAAILGQVHLHNTPPDKTPALLVAVLLRHYFKAGAYFPTQGGQVLAANLVEVIRSHGGELRTKARVRSIDVEAGRVQGVTLKTGERFHADVVVSNADAHLTFQKLIDPRHLSTRMRRKADKLRRPHSIFSTYLGADIDLSKTRPATNYLLHGRYDIQTTYGLLDRGQWDPKCWLAVSSPTLKTGGVRHFGPPGYTAIEMFAPAPAEREFWGGGDPTAGTGYRWSQIYRERKAEMEEVLVERTLEALPELRGHIVWRESGTPLTHERYTLSAMPYGPENAKDQIGPFRRLPVKTDIRGLYLAGASTAFLYGVAFTLRGGVGTASAILGRDLMRAFHRGEVLADPSGLPEHGPNWDPFRVSRGLSAQARSLEDCRIRGTAA